MPFDGTPSDKVRLIDEMLRVLGQNGKYWIKRHVTDHHGNHCMLGSLYEAERNLNLSARAVTEASIIEAIGQKRGKLMTVEAFNDWGDTRFADVQEVLEAAKVIIPAKTLVDMISMRATKEKQSAETIARLISCERQAAAKKLDSRSRKGRTKLPMACDPSQCIQPKPKRRKTAA